MLLTWWDAVLRLMCRRAAISGLDSPAPSSASTSRSRTVSVPVPLGPVRGTTPAERRNAATRSASRAAPRLSNPARACRACSMAASDSLAARARASSNRARAASSGSSSEDHSVSAASRSATAAPSPRASATRPLAYAASAASCRLVPAAAVAASRAAAAAAGSSSPAVEVGVDEQVQRGAELQPVLLQVAQPLLQAARRGERVAPGQRQGRGQHPRFALGLDVAADMRRAAPRPPPAAPGAAAGQPAGRAPGYASPGQAPSVIRAPAFSSRSASSHLPLAASTLP